MADFVVPDLLRSWPYPRRIHADPDGVEEASALWTAGFGFFGPRAQRAFDKSRFGLLVRLAYPDVPSDHLRVCCDVMNLFFVYDDRVDYAEPAHIATLGRLIAHALRHPDDDDDVAVADNVARAIPKAADVARMTRELSKRLHALTDAPAPFIDAFDAYLGATAIESVARAASKAGQGTPSVEDFLRLRRLTIGALPCFALLALGVPQGVVQDARVVQMQEAAIVMICIGNDLVSYRKEHAAGCDDHNILGVMVRSGRSLHEAVSEASAIHAYHEQAFLKAHTAWTQAPRGGKPGTAYVEGLGNWVRANAAWSIESGRYGAKK